MEEKCHSERDSKQHLNSVLPFYASLSSSFNELSNQQQPNLHHNHQHHHLLQQQPSEEHLLLNQPTSSRSNNSMSVIQEDFINIPHNYSEVLDDETTTSGVLDTFEISSSNSLPACSDTVDPIAVDDSSSTDTIKLSRNSVQNKNATHFFNDDDEVYVIDDDDLPPTTEQKSQLNLASSHLVDASLNGVIKVPSGTNIFLETPVVEEQQQQQLANIVGQLEYYEKTGHPKRLSDEFGLAEDSNVIEIDTNDEDEDDDEDDVVKNQIEQKKLLSSGSCYLPVGLSDLSCSDGLNESQHDKMSSRLKKMTLGGRLSVVENLDSRLHQDSNFQDACTSDAAQLPDIESMDFIERRDFETEQKLTGGITIKNRTLIDQDMINLNLIKSCIQPPNPSDYSDDIPCSSTSNTHARTVSSDSKCNYKDPATTPTSSRTFSQAKSKSTTAKLNYRHLNYGEEIQDFSKPSTSSNIPFVVEDDAPTTSSFTSRIKGQNLFKVSGIKSDIFCNSNSNESLSVNGNDNDESRRDSTESQREKRSDQWHNELIDNQGCSRTTALIQQQHSNGYEPASLSSSNIAMPTVYDEDAQPSTSSARCQYVRQVQHASAQTVERYLPRSSGSSTSSSSLNTNSNELSSRGRRRTDSSASSSNRKNNSEEGSGSGSSTSGGSGSSAATAFKQHSMQKPIPALRDHVMFNENSWIDCDESSFAEQEEICTCDHNSFCDETGSNTSLNDNEDFDFTLSKSTSQFASLDDTNNLTADGGVHNISTSHGNAQRKRKYNDSRLIDTDSIAVKASNGCNSELNSRKRVAYDCASSPRSSQLINISTPSTSQLHTTFSPMGKRTPRSLIPSRDNPPPELQSWLQQFQRWSNAERLLAVDRLIENCNPTQVRHMMKIIEPQFQRDFISLLPRELALSVLSYLEPKDLLRAAQTCRSWRFLCDDNLLWKEKCRKAQILTEPKTDLPKRGRAGTMPPISSPWKAAYMRQHIIEMNWRSRPIREKKILKGHDDHVITCLQFSGNRIVSGSDDNTLKVWSAVTGRCLLTLSGHTGGVWSSQMSGKTIISGSTDRTLKVWDMETGACIHTLQGHTSTVRCMHLHGKKVVSGSRDATLRVWDIERGSCLHLLVGHLAAVRCVQYDGKLIVSGAYDYMVKVWHPERQECLHTLQGHTNRVYSLQFDGVHVVSGSLDTSIKVWEVETGNCKHTLMGHQSLTSGMELRQNILVSGNADSTVKVWDITTGQCLQTLSGPNKHQSAVTCLQFNSRFVITSSDDGTVKLWDVKTGEFIRNLVTLPSGGSGGVVWRIRASDTKLICAVGSRNGTEETKLMVLDFDVEGACLKCS